MSVMAPTLSTVKGAGTDVGELPFQKHRIRVVVFAFVMLFTGGAGLLYQNVYTVVYTYLLGNSIEQLGITSAVMFLAFGLGAMVQRFLIKALAEIFILSEVFLALLGGFAVIGTQWLFAYTGDDFAWIKFVQLLITGFLIGMEIPLLMKINERYSKNLGENIADTWAWDYIGGFLFGILWLWALHNYIPITHLGVYTGICNLIVAAVSLVFFWREGLLKWRWSGPTLTVIVIGVAVALVSSLTQVDSWSKTINQKLYEDPIVFEAQTKYQQIVITQSDHSTIPGDVNNELFLNGNKQFSSVDEAMYHEQLVHPAMGLASERRHVLILGGGDGMAMREVLKYPDVEDVTLVDLDPDMIKLAQTNPILTRLNRGSFKDARVHVQINNGVTDTGKTRDILMETGEENVQCDQHDSTVKCDSEPVLQSAGKVDIFTVDADQFINAQHRLFDVVIVDLPDPNSIELAKLYSLEFYQKIRQALSPDGIVVVQATSPYHSKEAYVCVLRTMAAAGLGVLPYHDNVPSFGDWGWVLGSPSLSGQALHERAENLDDFPVPTREVDSNVFKSALVFKKEWLNSPNREISTMMQPVIYDFYNNGWKVE